MFVEDFKFLIAQRMQSFAPLLLSTLLDKRLSNLSISADCSLELINLSSSALRNEPSALKVFDSSGQLQAGLSSGAIFNSFGNYEQCLDYSGKVITKYCLAQFDLSSEARQLNALLNELPVTIFNPSIGGRAAKFGLCLPISCSNQDLTTLTNHVIQSTLNNPFVYVQEFECYREQEGLYQTGIGFIISMILIIFFISSCVTSTILDSIKTTEQHSNETTTNQSKFMETFIKTFSLNKSFKKLMNKRKRIVPFKSFDLTALDGLRVISMLWIIAIHSYNFGFQWLNFDNLKQVDNVYKTIGIQWLANGTFSVDNFFLISGLLTWLNHYKSMINNKTSPSSNEWQESPQAYCEVKRKLSDNSSSSTVMISNQQINSNRHQTIEERTFLKSAKVLLISILKRYLRLMPIMMIMILFSVTILPNFAYGPNWLNSTRMFDSWCHSNWYLNLFMLQNLINTPNMCFSHSWYVATDFQLYLLIQLILIIMTHLKSNIKKWHLLICGILLSQLIVAFIIYQNQLPSVPLIPANSLEAVNDYYRLIYIKPYYWLASYFLGALLATSLMAINSRNLGKVKLRGRMILVMQLSALTILICLLISTLPYFNGSLHMTSLQATAYSFIVRPLWSICVASLLLFSILSSRYVKRKNLLARSMKNMFNSKIWLPFSRLSYSAYLIHPIVMATFYGSRTETFKFSHYLLIYFTLGNIIITYFCAFVLHLFIELPIKALINELSNTKLLFDYSKSRNKATFINLTTQQQSS